MLISSDLLRERFSQAMSQMYRREVPAYGELMTLVAEVNARVLDSSPELKRQFEATGALDRISDERHGAIRLGTAEELSMMRRAFAVMGMFPVGYYDLSVAGIPVHSTAFRPIQEASLKLNPFRVFTSLLRLDLLEDVHLREEATAALAQRSIFTDRAVALITQAEISGGLAKSDADEYVAELLETFRWHDRATVSLELYQRLLKAHRLVADVVSFKGPHINHLTPRTLDIDQVQNEMACRGIVPKEAIEGPPPRYCPILLRQTSFKALKEPIAFRAQDGSWVTGSHTARFGEIEQRGIAPTRKGRDLYDRLLAEAQHLQPASSSASLDTAHEAFVDFPDDYAALREQQLAHFEYVVTKKGKVATGIAADGIEDLVALGYVSFHPIIYEDFLPVSAAGIFQSNLGEQAAQRFVKSPNKDAFEQALGATVLDEFSLYEAIEQGSITRCLKAFSGRKAV